MNMYHDRIKILKNRYSQLSEQINTLCNSDNFEHDDVVMLKEQRLNIKNQISLLENRQEFIDDIQNTVGTQQ